MLNHGSRPGEVAATGGGRTFVGFGFGAIQAGLFLFEAFKSGRFNRMVVAELLPDLVASLRRAKGRYGVNVATRAGIVHHFVDGIEILNPSDASDRQKLIEAVAEADELGTALPSVGAYCGGGEAAVVEILRAAFELRVRAEGRKSCVIYTAENHNHAAEILGEGLSAKLGVHALDCMAETQILNTVIGKMSGIVSDPCQIHEQGLMPITPKSERCFLVEEFNRILISRIRIPGFERGIGVFEEREDLLPFEEAKLFGHNAAHALLGFLARLRGFSFVSQAAGDRELMDTVRGAFLEESGRALCQKHAGVDPLFTPSGFHAYAEDLLERMVNPHLRDAVDRIVRDPLRKLGWDDRLVGTMRLILDNGGSPTRYALGAAAAFKELAGAARHPSATDDEVWDELWGPGLSRSPQGRVIVGRIAEAARRLDGWKAVKA